MLRSIILPIVAGAAGALTISGCAPVQQLQNVAAAGGALANSVTGTGEQVALSAGELRQLQTREFETTRAAAFASVMTVLLDSGYRILSADLESGLITAAAHTTDRLRLDPAGVARASQTPVASAYVEDRGPGAVRVRVAFSIGVSGTGRLGSSGERTVLDERVYASFFARLEDEIRERPAAAGLEVLPQEISPASSDGQSAVPRPDAAPSAGEIESKAARSDETTLPEEVGPQAGKTDEVKDEEPISND